MDNRIKLYLDKYDTIYDELYELQDERNEIRNTNPKRAELLQKLIDEKKVEIDAFEDEFARYIFEINIKTNPKLVDRFDKKKIKFIDAFADDYSKVSKLKKSSLIGLYTDSGKYRFK